jgi:hypothetical protein
VNLTMDLHDVSLALAGVIGGGVAVIHGVLTERLMVRRLRGEAGAQFPATIRRLMAGLLHFSTFNWFLGGLVLIVAAFAFQREAKLVAAVLVGSSYLFGAVGNLWATRGRHQGWVLMAVALLLIVYGIAKPGA